MAEDNRPDVSILRQALADLRIPFDIQVVDDGEKAIQLIGQVEADEAACAADLVMLDLNLPRRDGLEVLRRIRESRKWQSAKVVMMSSSDSAEEWTKIQQLGADRYFQKSADLDQFLKIGQVVRELLEREAAESGSDTGHSEGPP